MRVVPLHRILVLSACAMVLPWLAISIAALPTMSAYIAPEQIARAEAVANIVATAVEEVLGLDIPLAEEPGMRSYLEQILNENPGVRFIALCDTAKTIVHAAQAVTEDEAVLKLTTGTQLAATEASLVNASFVTRRLMHNGQVLGEVVVGQSLSVPPALARGLILDLTTGLAVLLLFGLEAVRLVVDNTISTPLAAVNALLSRIARQDLTSCLVLDGAGKLPAVAVAINRVAKALHDRCSELLTYAEEVRSAGKDRQLGPAIDARVAQFRQSVRLAERAPAERPPLLSVAPLRFAWFLLAAGAAAGWPRERQYMLLLVEPLILCVLAATAMEFLRTQLLSRRATWTLCAAVLVLSVPLVWESFQPWVKALAFSSSLVLIGSVLCRVPRPGSAGPEIAEGTLAGIAAGLGLRALLPPDAGVIALLGDALVAMAWAVTLLLSRRDGPTYFAPASPGLRLVLSTALPTRVPTWLLAGVSLAALRVGANGAIETPDAWLFIVGLAAFLGHMIGAKLATRFGRDGGAALGLRLVLAATCMLLGQGAMWPTLTAGAAMGAGFAFAGLWALEHTSEPRHSFRARGVRFDALTFALGWVLAEIALIPTPLLLTVLATLPLAGDLAMRGRALWPRTAKGA